MSLLKNTISNAATAAKVVANIAPMATIKKPVALIRPQNKLLLFCFGVLIKASGLQAQATPCNTLQTLSSSQMQQLAPLWPLLDSALFHENTPKTDSLCRVIKTVLGPQGGIPDQLETPFALTTSTVWLPFASALGLAHTVITNDSTAYDQLWKTAQGRHPQKNYADHSLFLRFAAENAVGLLQIAGVETNPSRKARYTQWATRTLDTLLNRQLASGAFPFPDLRTYNDPTFGPIIQAFLLSCGADSVNVLVNGWIINDKGSGEFKFDAGIIADAFYRAYVYTGNTNYKTACVKAATYLAQQRLSRNFNYNSFVALGCGRGYQCTSDTFLLRKMHVNLRTGLLSGQQINGRWFDGHNARSVYHGLMLKHLAQVVNLLPPGKEQDTLVTALNRGINNHNTYYLQCGYSGSFRWQMACIKNTLVQARHDSLAIWIGRHIQQSALNGKFLDVPTIGDYLELLPLLTTLPETVIKKAPVVYPNPTAGALTIEMTTENTCLVLFNALGQPVFRTTLVAGSNNIRLPDELRTGVYFLSIEQGNGTKIIKKLLYNAP